jgi:membrane peptidoglycan carboxypeptidase
VTGVQTCALPICVEPYTITAVVDRAGDVLEYRTAALSPAISPQESWLMTELLREPVRRGTAKGLSKWGLEKAAAAKTGTTNDGRDAWFLGYMPGLVAGVWTGKDIPTKSAMTGASAAMPIWAAFMSAAAPWPDSAGDPWPRPEGIATAEIDPESGALARSGCPTRVTEYYLPGTEPKDSCPLHAAGVVGWLKRLFKRQR